MASTTTKKLKTEAKSAIKEGFASRDWSPSRGTGLVFVAPAGLVQDPFALEWSLEIESYKYGGATVTGAGVIRCDQIGDILVDFDRSTMVARIQRLEDREWRRSALGEVDVVLQGQLMDPSGNYHQWIVDDEHPVDSVVSEFFTMIDGPFTQWVAARCTSDQLLRRYDDPAKRQGLSGLRARILAALAVTTGMVDLARLLVKDCPVGHGDSPEQLAAFEAELARRFPDYGALQRA